LRDVRQLPANPGNQPRGIPDMVLPVMRRPNHTLQSNVRIEEAENLPNAKGRTEVSTRRLKVIGWGYEGDEISAEEHGMITSRSRERFGGECGRFERPRRKRRSSSTNLVSTFP